MTKKLRFLIILFILTLIILIMGGLYVFLNKQETENSSEPITYVLKKHNDTLAIFIDGESEPYKTLDVTFNNLPFLDKEQLIKGLYSNNLKEIMKYAEDYDG